MNKADTVADTSACVLVIVMLSSAVPPALIDGVENVLEMVGRDVVTVSVSPAEQTPATVQEPDVLVLVTLGGGVIVAILVTWVWARAIELIDRNRNAKAASTSIRQTRNTPTVSNEERDALKSSKLTPLTAI
ncbi:MAG: hypothetical protein Q7T87_19485 [Polaromonas sp.]|nr:hypothetical protein [Polaromonas sp.]